MNRKAKRTGAPAGARTALAFLLTFVMVVNPLPTQAFAALYDGDENAAIQEGGTDDSSATAPDEPESKATNDDEDEPRNDTSAQQRVAFTLTAGYVARDGAEHAAEALEAGEAAQTAQDGASSEDAADAALISSTSDEDDNQDAIAEDATEEPGGPQSYALRLIVGLRDGEEPRETDEVLGAHDGTVLIGFDDPGQLVEAQAYYALHANWVQTDTKLGAAEAPEAPEGLPIPVDEEDNALTLLAALDAEQDERADGEDSARKDVLVALIDTGAPVTADEQGEEHLDAAITEAVSVLGEDYADRNGHAAKMLDAMKGESPDVRVLSVKALDDEGLGSASSVYAAIQYAIQAKADVVNLSLSGFATSGNAAIADAVSDALAAGIVVVAAAGNGGYDAKYYTPGNVAGVFTVGAAEDNGTVRDDSNAGECVDMYVTADSTSVAAARTSGWLSANGAAAGWRDKLLESTLNANSRVSADLRVGEATDGVRAAANVEKSYSTSGSESYTIPSSGWYKLEAWGATGGGSIVNSEPKMTRGALGGYTYGITYFNAGEKIYIEVGGRGSDASLSSSTVSGGYNGGGYGTHGSTAVSGSGGGGGATHFATKPGLLSSLEDYQGQVILVAGGGGGAANNSQNGVGGGYGGYDGTTNKKPGQTKNNGTYDFLFGQGADGPIDSKTYGSAGGGGGWYGGKDGGTASAPSGGGGSGRIGGNAVVWSSTTMNNNSTSTANPASFLMSDGETERVIYGVTYFGASTTYPKSTNYDATNGNDGFASITSVDPHVLTLEKGEGSGGPSALYVIAKNGVYANAACEPSTKMTRIDNAIEIPRREGYSFQGYYTKESGGTQIINASGHLVTNNKKDGYNSDLRYQSDLLAGTALYARWQPAEITTGKETASSWAESSKGYERTFTAPDTGWYCLNAWGADGGDSYGNGYTHSFHGYGGYSFGYVHLDQGDVLYVYAGGSGTNGDGSSTGAATFYAGGYNGGGQGSNDGQNESTVSSGTYKDSPANEGAGAGGGATHFATIPGLLSSLERDSDKVVLVAGGGGGAASSTRGGAGGGVAGGAPNGGGELAGQNTGYAFGMGESATEVLANCGSGGGGGGWYGGYRGRHTTGTGGGGSGRVGGVETQFADGGFMYDGISVTHGQYKMGGSVRPIYGRSYVGGSKQAGYVQNPNGGTSSKLNGYIKIEKLATYTVRLNPEGGSGGTTEIYEAYRAGLYLDAAATAQRIPSGRAAIALPTREGYAFAGYYTKTDGGGTQLIDAEGIVNSDFTYSYFKANGDLYAYWEPVEVVADPDATSWNVSFTGTQRTFSVPRDGWYHFDALGGDGGNSAAGGNGGRRGEVQGYAFLKKNDKLYVNVGGRGRDGSIEPDDWTTATSGFVAGGYNGGGLGAWYGGDSTAWRNGGGAGGGGGATTVSFASGAISSTAGDARTVLMAGGGGGGGVTGNSGGNALISSQPNDGGKNATQTSGYGVGKGQDGTIMPDNGTAGGGAGWYGGYAGELAEGGSAGGGSNHIGGASMRMRGDYTGAADDYSDYYIGTFSRVSGSGEVYATSVTPSASGKATDKGSVAINYQQLNVITVDKQGGSGGPEKLYSTAGVGVYSDADNTTANLLYSPIVDGGSGQIPVPTKGGLEFGGYYSKPGGDGDRLFDPDGTMTALFTDTYFSEDSAIYACWIDPVAASAGDEIDLGYTGAVQKIIMPSDGWYKLQAWGGNGGGAWTDGAATDTGGLGGYSYGYTRLKKNEVLYFAVGGKGTDGVRDPDDDPARLYPGGYNGGGRGSTDGATDEGVNNAGMAKAEASGGGGGATHFATTLGSIGNIIGGADTVVLVAGGGGGGSGNTRGGAGGGKEGGVSSVSTSSKATQTAGYKQGYGQDAEKPMKNMGVGGGGGGWWGGTARTASNTGNNQGGGGSGRIGGSTAANGGFSGNNYVPNGTFDFSDGSQRAIYGYTYQGGVSGVEANPATNPGEGFAKVTHLAEYTIVFDKQLGSGGTDKVYQVYEVGTFLDQACDTQQMSGSDNPIDIPTRPGDYFVGYFTEPYGRGDMLIDESGYITSDWVPDYFDGTEPLKLYASWETAELTQDDKEGPWNARVTKTERTFTVPQDGWYFLEGWGGNGGYSWSNGAQNTGKSGVGGYAYGYVYLKKNEKLYLNVGGAGTNAKRSNNDEKEQYFPGGYNGGGRGSSDGESEGTNGANNSQAEGSGGGGGATSWATSSGLLASFDAERGPVVLVAGGGGGGNWTTQGGHGGGKEGVKDTSNSIASQTAGWAFGQGKDAPNTGSSGGIAGAGGGWYGGYSKTGTADSVGGGGSGRVGGATAEDGGFSADGITVEEGAYVINGETRHIHGATMQTGKAGFQSSPSRDGGGWARSTFLPTYTISLAPMGGTGGTQNVYESWDVGVYMDSTGYRWEMTDSTYPITIPRLAGYTFAGYYTEPLGLGDMLIDEKGYITADFSPIYFDEDSALYAFWVEEITTTDQAGPWDVPYQSRERSFTAPRSGYYFLQAWGAQGGGTAVSGGGYVTDPLDSTQKGGKGGYSQGYVYLEKGDTVFINTGQWGNSAEKIANGGNYYDASYNGGGASSAVAGGTVGGGAGGGMTGISWAPNSTARAEWGWNSTGALLVAGGGGGSNYNSTTNASNTKAGGNGGGKSGSGGVKYTGSGSAPSAGTDANNSGSKMQGVGTSMPDGSASGGGGGGWWGGGANTTANSYCSGAGGSGYLGSANGLLQGATTDGSKKFKDPEGADETGHTGDGFARVTYHAPIVVTLDDGPLGSGGSGAVYQATGFGVYLDEDCSDLMETLANPVDAPLRTGSMFEGYYTAETGGTCMIDEDGYITSSFKNNTFSENTTLYARWVTAEITEDHEDDVIWEVPHKKAQRTFTVPADGWYKLEAWGADGGGSRASGKVQKTIGGTGGYSYGYSYLRKGEVFYLTVGGKGAMAVLGKNVAGGFNGGGSGSNDGAYKSEGDNAESSGGGGGATHWATKPGLLETLADSSDQVMIVAGGGGGSGYNYLGGAGGGRIGGPNGKNAAANQNDGYAFGAGQPANVQQWAGAGGGGGGWWGGYSGNIASSSANNVQGGGGSGRVGGASTTFEADDITVPEGTFAMLNGSLRDIFGATYKGGSGNVRPAAAGNDGYAIAQFMPIYTIRLEKQGGSGGTDNVYEAYEVGIFADAPCTTYRMEPDANPIVVPTNGSLEFAGYFTEPDGQGWLMIGPDGYKTEEFYSTYFDEDSELYACWVTNVSGLDVDLEKTGTQGSFTAPRNGWYLLESWGGTGGGAIYNGALKPTEGGKGGYSYGYVYLEAGETVYYTVGGRGTDGVANDTAAGGYNGGGYGSFGKTSNNGSGGGGGASHWASVPGGLFSLNVRPDNVILVAGGGGGSSCNTGGGAGGGATGVKSGKSSSNQASQTGGYDFGQGEDGVGDASHSYGGAGGGGGWYGGYKGLDTTGASAAQKVGGGGSGRVGGTSSVFSSTYYVNNGEFAWADGSARTVVGASFGGAVASTVANNKTPDPDWGGEGHAHASYFAPYKITLDDTIGAGGSGQVYQTYGLGVYIDEDNTMEMTSSEYPVLIPLRFGSIFMGYYTGQDGTGTQMIDENGYITSAFSTKSFTGDDTLYAYWFTAEITDGQLEGPWDVPHKKAERTFTAPADGWYKLEGWGGTGGGSVADNNASRGKATGGVGGYSYGYAYMKAGEIMYLTVGGKGAKGAVNKNVAGGFNGGGSGSNDGCYKSEGASADSSGGGGGATHFATRSGLIDSLADSTDQIVVVAGGGGGSAASYLGGVGGGRIGGANGGNASASQNAGYAIGSGQPANVQTWAGAGGGGGGWYGGYAGNKTSYIRGGGGSGRVGGASTTFASDGIIVADGSYALGDGTERFTVGATMQGGSSDAHYVANPDASGDGHAIVSPVDILTITLDKQGGSGGTDQVYHPYDVAPFLDAAAFEKRMTATDNPVDVPTRAGYAFGGYFTEENGAGLRFINADGHISADFARDWFADDGELYACWIKDVSGTEVDVASDGEQKSFTAPIDGWYLLEAWGGNGGGAKSSSATNPAEGGKGGYSYGRIFLKEGETIYLTVGGSGSDPELGSNAAGGYNGGGAGGDGSNGSGGSGGGASHFATVPGGLASLHNESEAVILVAGGGGGSSLGYAGAVGGGKEGARSGISTSSKATQTNGNAFGQGQDGIAGVAQGSGGGGGGWYGGFTSQNTSNGASSKYGGGGSGRVGGETSAFASDNINVPSGTFIWAPDGSQRTIAGATYPGNSTAAGFVARDADWGREGHIHIKYEKPLEITLDDQGGSGGTGKVYEAYTVSVYLDEDMAAEMDESENPVNVPTRSGYFFDGYFSAPNGGGTRLISSDGFRTAAFDSTWFTTDDVVYARWIKEEIYDGTDGPWDAEYSRIQRSFTAPADGYYKLQAWGAQGGGAAPGAGNYQPDAFNANQKGGRGGYTEGYFYMKAGDKVYLYTGQWGNNAEKLAHKGHYYDASLNGGGAGDASGGGAGGGMTHITLSDNNFVTGSWSPTGILAIAGGGGGSDTGGAYDEIGKGGVGGGENGGKGGRQVGSASYQAPGGGQAAGSGSGVQGIGASSVAGRGNGAGGGGWYGGATTSSGNQKYYAGGGGSGYIGAAGLVNGATLDGTKTFEAPGGGTETGHPGDGYARVTYFKPYEIALVVNDYDAGGRGTEKLFESYSIGVFADVECAVPMDSGDDIITIPVRTGYSFAGYFTGPGGAGTQMIDAYGVLTPAFTNTFFSDDAELYACWVKDITSSGTTEWEAPYEDATRSFIAPKDGFYKLQVWGAQGGGTTDGGYEMDAFAAGQKGGRGGYSEGLVFLQQGEIVYLFTGQWGNNAAKTNPYDASYNGGGAGDAAGGGAGGGMTHISRTLNSVAGAGETWSDANVLIIAGGGGGSNGTGGASAAINQAGQGGGENGINVNGANGGAQARSGSRQQGVGASSVAGSLNGAGGGGWWGGASSTNASGTYAGAGGSGYVGSSELRNGTTFDGTKEFVAPPNSTWGETEIGHPGDGYARITIIEPIKVELDDYVPTTVAGQGYVYEVYGIGVFVDEGCSLEMAADENRVDIPTASKMIFDGYWTEPDPDPGKNKAAGVTRGTQMITQSGYITPAFVNTYFDGESPAKLYAQWIPEEITLDKESDPYWDAPFVGAQRTFTAPQDGWYKLEGWGANGGGAHYGNTNWAKGGGYGGYSYGYTYLHKGDMFYIATGGSGAIGKVNKAAAGGYNGGGSGNTDGCYASEGSQMESAGGGGGATHYATVRGLLPDLAGNAVDVALVAGGGGGAAGGARGGAGGGKEAESVNAGQATQVSGNAFGQGQDATKVIRNYGAGGGGGGWYGGKARTSQGGTGSWYGRGGGGSGRVGGESSPFESDGVTVSDGSYKFATSGDTHGIFGASYAGGKSGVPANPSGTIDGFARVTYQPAYKVELDNQGADTGLGGSEAVYDVNHVGIFDDDVSTNKLTTAQNPIVVPQRSGYIFDGYYTSPNGAGSRMILPQGYISAAFTDMAFTSDGTLYANWIPREIYDSTPGPWSAPYADQERTFTAPQDGWYKLQVWGAQGGGTLPGVEQYQLDPFASSQKGGRGGYSEGAVYLTASQVVYIYTGQWGNDSTKTAAGGKYYTQSFNGGGASGVSPSTYTGGAGGGMSHMSTTSGNAVSDTWRPSDVLIAAGGGGGTDNAVSDTASIMRGGVGGGESGGAGVKQGGSGTAAAAGTQIVASGSGKQGYGADTPLGNANGGGGGGWWGGGVSSGDSGYFSGAGGSGYVNASTLVHGATYDGKQTFVAPPYSTWGATETGHPGNGAAAVEFLPTRTITLDDTAGTGGSGSVVEAYTVGIFTDTTYATELTVTTNPVAVPTTSQPKLSFAGYYTGKDGAGVQMIGADGFITANFTPTAFSSDATLYAYWVEDISDTGNDDVWNIGYKDMTRSFTAPKDGFYKLQAWGAQGGGADAGSGYVMDAFDANQKGGRGAYSEGMVFLAKGETIYIHTGQWGNSASKTTDGGQTYDASYNGGGAGNAAGGGAGGGMTHFSSQIANTAAAGYAWDSTSALVIAGGGGGSNGADAFANMQVGGVGGGTSGGAGGSAGGSQSRSGSLQQGVGASAADDNANGAGGGGWWGGGSNTAPSLVGKRSGGGGSGYTQPTTVVAASTLDGTQTFKAPNGSDEVGHPGDGYARIAYEPPHPVKLDDTDAQATGGSGHVYEMYGIGVYLDEGCANEMTDEDNRVEIPVREGWVFGGYYDTPDPNPGKFKAASASGTMMIDSSGYITSSFVNTLFTDDTGVLYAWWEPEEITDDREDDSSWDAPFNKAQRTFTAPRDGWYLLEGWGGDGGNGMGNNLKNGTRGGRGSYTYGYVHLTAGEKFYIATGGKGQRGQLQDVSEGGWNGGGKGNEDGCYESEGSSADAGGGGGGATTYATVRGFLTDLETATDNIAIVAAGGGGSVIGTTGSAGGGEVAYSNSSGEYADQTSGYAWGVGGDGVVKKYYGAGGGGAGWYGGYGVTDPSTSASAGGGGGSGRVGGVSSDFETDGVTVPEGLYRFDGSSDNRLIIGASYHGNRKTNPSKAGEGYARVSYVDPYQIDLDDQGGSGGSGAVYEAYGLGIYMEPECNTDLAILGNAVDVPVKDGSDFGGYWTAPGGTGTRMISNDGKLLGTFTNKTFSAPATLYAKWNVKAHALLTLDGSELIFFRSDEPFVHGDQYTVTIDGVEYEGYVYEGIESATYATQGDVPWLSGGKANMIEKAWVAADPEPISPVSTANWFSGCRRLTDVDILELDTTQVSTMDNMFAGCKALEELDISNVDVQSCTSMTGMFDGCEKLRSVTLGRNFSFKGNGTTVLTQLPDAPSFNGFKGTWTRDINNSSAALKAADLASTYSASMAGTWVWMPRAVLYTNAGGSGMNFAEAWVAAVAVVVASVYTARRKRKDRESDDA